MCLSLIHIFTFGIPAEGIAEARPRLERVEADVMGNLKRLGVPSEPMDGRARLALLYSQMHPGSREAFRFSWKGSDSEHSLLLKEVQEQVSTHPQKQRLLFLLKK